MVNQWSASAIRTPRPANGAPSSPRSDAPAVWHAAAIRPYPLPCGQPMAHGRAGNGNAPCITDATSRNYLFGLGGWKVFFSRSLTASVMSAPK
eukprot:5479549-Lingulodinium_polyedra.AAC.1